MRKTKKITLLANFLAIAIVLNIVESAIAIVPVPGAKLGLANVVTLIVIYIYGIKDGAILTISRVFLVGLLTGKLLGPVFYMGMGGAIFSVTIMGVLKKIKVFGIVGTSILGSVFHCIGQIVAAYIFIINSVGLILYLPIMLFLSVPAGVVTGIIASRFLNAWDAWYQPTI